MNKLTALAIALVTGAAISTGTVVTTGPDFAFPKTVISNADSVLAVSKEPGERMQALMQKCVALQSIDPDSAFVLPGLVASYAERESDAAYRGLLKLFQARLLADIYSQKSYAYNRVAAPQEPLPADVALWSGEQFRSETGRLISEAGRILAPYWNTSLKNYSSVIETGENTLIFYPLLRDFVALSSISIADCVGLQQLVEPLRHEILDQLEPGTAEWVSWVEDSEAAELYERYSTGLVGGVLLYKIPKNQGADTALVGLLNNYLETEPENIITDALRDKLKMVTRPEATIETPSTAYPGEDINVKLRGYWLKDADIILYRLKDGYTQRHGRVEQSDLDKIDSRQIQYQEYLPEITDSVTFQVSNDGIYYVELKVDGKSAGNYARMNVSSYVPFLIGQKGRYALAVVNAYEGKPLKGGSVYFNSDKNGSARVASTDGNGLAMFGMSDINYNDFPGYISVSKGKNTYNFGREVVIYNNYFGSSTNKEVNARFFTDRPVYQPGDTVRWSLVLGHFDEDFSRSSVCRNVEISVGFYDVNYKKVDSLQVVTDDMGRASGQFAVPADRLAGIYHLNLEETPYMELFPVSQYSQVTVSDFKMPQFEIKDFSATVLGDGSISVSGDAVTFSGMPVIDAAVSLSLEPRPLWRFWGEYNIAGEAKSAVLTGKTDSYGHFTLVADTAQITKRINYNINATVTDRAAEIATASVTVRADNRLFFSYTGDRMVNVDKGFIQGLCVVDATSAPMDETVQWQLLKSGKAVAGGICSINDNGASIDLSDIHAGTYRLALRQDDNQHLQPDTIEITTYSIKHNSVPSDIPLLIPENSVKAPAHGKGTILIGVPRKSSVYVFTYSATSLLSAEYHELGAGFHKIATPEGSPDARYSVCIALVDGKKFVTNDVSVICENPDALKMSVESWRDNLLPGSRETITLKIMSDAGNLVNAGVIATLYNAALDKLMPSFKNNFCAQGNIFPQFNFYLRPSLSVLSTLRGYNDSATFRDISRYRGAVFSIDIPSFRYLFQSQRVYYKAMPTLMASARSANGVNDLVLCEDTVEECEMEASPAMGYSVAATADTEAAAEDSDAQISEPELRMGEILQAFWRPDMVTDEDGSVNIIYTVPDANGTWRFLATAWNNALYAASIDRSAISSKPIMVQPAVPRFLRRGDTATLEATIYNKTGEPADVNYIIEIFEPVTGKVIISEKSSCRIDAMGSALVQIAGVGTSDNDAIGYRVKATTDVYTDGEQNLIPILDSGMTVFDSSTFYLTDSNPTYVTTVPSAEGARNVLDYCGNPVWDVVKALPALYDRNPRTGYGAVRAIYGAMTARGLARKFPEISRAINIWQENPSDSALVSDLYKNESLKNLMLQQTPWEWAAADNTSRMERLALTFSPKEINTVLDRGIAALESLQRPDGGFAWGTWSTRSDLYTTESILSVLGSLAEQGFLEGSARIDTLINKAFRYVDDRVKPDDSRYAYVASLFPGRMPLSDNARAALNYGVSQAQATWKRAGNVTKASMALMLNATGHEKEAREIIRSIRQFEVKSPLAGISFPSVDAIDGYSVIIRAFAKIDPQMQELDGMRQWLVLRSQATDNLGSWDPTSLISAILSTGSHWTTLRAAQAPVSLGGHSLPISNAESVTGSFSMVLPDDAAGSSMEITRPGGSGVSYGSLTSVYTVPMETVEARSSDAVEVTKRFLVADGEGWRETTTFSHGERVKVQITLRVKRQMEYLTVVDDRPAAFEPVEQMPGYVYADGLRMYREVDDSRTCLFIDDVTPGVYTFSYDMTAATAGNFASGPVTVQSQYAPELNARSGSARINVKL